jgi:hypothetical protein
MWYGHLLRYFLSYKKEQNFCTKSATKIDCFLSKKSSNCRKYVYYFRHSFHKFFFICAWFSSAILTKKVMWYGHLLRSVQVKNGKKKVRLGNLSMTKIIFIFLLVFIFKEHKGWEEYGSYILTFYRSIIHARYLYEKSPMEIDPDSKY